MAYIDIRFEITPDTVDEKTTAHFVQNFVMQKFEFIESATPIEGVHLDFQDNNPYLDEARAVKRVQSGEGN
jgi:hypothetical protein